MNKQKYVSDFFFLFLGKKKWKKSLSWLVYVWVRVFHTDIVIFNFTSYSDKHKPSLSYHLKLYTLDGAYNSVWYICPIKQFECFGQRQV